MPKTRISDAPPLKQLNVRLPGKVHRELKAKAALDGLSLADAIAELVRAYLAGKVTITRKTE